MMATVPAALLWWVFRFWMGSIGWIGTIVVAWRFLRQWSNWWRSISIIGFGDDRPWWWLWSFVVRLLWSISKIAWTIVNVAWRTNRSLRWRLVIIRPAVISSITINVKAAIRWWPWIRVMNGWRRWSIIMRFTARSKIIWSAIAIPRVRSRFVEIILWTILVDGSDFRTISVSLIFIRWLIVGWWWTECRWLHIAWIGAAVNARRRSTVRCGSIAFIIVIVRMRNEIWIAIVRARVQVHARQWNLNELALTLSPATRI